MKGPLSYPAFRTLFAAQVLSLVAIGLLTVGLSLAAYAIGGNEAAGSILGLIFALKMVAYVGLAPLAETILAGQPRKGALIGLDLGRMLLLLPMVLVAETWQIAALAFAFFALSAAFTPLFQSVIPDILPEEDTYTRALAYSRIAYTLEAVLSPVIAAALLRFVAAENLFLFAALAFVGSIAALMVTRISPVGNRDGNGPFLQRALKGLRIYTQTPRLRGLFLLNLSLSLAMAWVLVNSVAYAGLHLGDAERYFPILMASYGFGAAMGAVIVPRLLTRWSERSVMLAGTVAFAMLGGLVALHLPYTGLLGVWAGFGFASSLVLTPGGLIIIRSARQGDRPAVFAAHFSLSHAGWLVSYPLAGWLGALAGLENAILLLSGLALLTAFVATRVWQPDDPLMRAHAHPELPDDHPHLRDIPATGPSHLHRHAYYIDPLHPHWSGSRAS